MSEFKAQLLGILLVISIFGVLAGAYRTLVENSLETINNEISNQLSNKA